MISRCHLSSIPIGICGIPSWPCGGTAPTSCTLGSFLIAILCGVLWFAFRCPPCGLTVCFDSSVLQFVAHSRAVSGSLARSSARLYELGPDQISMQHFFHNLRMDRPDAGRVARMMQEDQFDSIYDLPQMPEPPTASGQIDSIMWCMSQGPFHFRHTEGVKDNSLIPSHPTYPLTQLQQIKGTFVGAITRAFQVHTFLFCFSWHGRSMLEFETCCWELLHRSPRQIHHPCWSASTSSTQASTGVSWSSTSVATALTWLLCWRFQIARQSLALWSCHGLSWSLRQSGSEAHAPEVRF